MKQIQCNKKILTMAALALLMAGCANDDTVPEGTPKQSDRKGMTEFAIADNAANTKASPATRTAGEYTGTGIKFYWTSGDKLWINNTAASPSLKASNSSTIPDTGGKELTAKFYFNGIYTATTYPVRYTGANNSAGDEVTIKAEQSQQTPNYGAHIGADGDCGTATATRQPDGSYLFDLDHKAAYLTFAPFDSNGALGNTISVEKIKVTADKSIAGTYGFDDSGILTASVTNPSNTITLTLSGSFIIPTASDYTKNGAIMVLAPGTYTDLKVEYTLKDSKTGVSATVQKKFSNLTLNAGKNRIVKSDLKLRRYEMKYYLWDAIKDYWDTYAGVLPIVDGDEAPFHGLGTNRDANWETTNLYATRSCATSPNANEAALYAFRGDPHWDGTTPWVMNNHLYVGGMWFLKLQYCIGGPYTSPVTQYPDMHDYRQNDEWKDWDELDPANYHNKWINPHGPAQGKPSDTSKYFYLPAMGYIENLDGTLGKFKIGAYGTYFGFYNGYSGVYWTSTSVVKSNSSRQAVSLHFSDSEVGLEVDDREWGYPLFKVDGE